MKLSHLFFLILFPGFAHTAGPNKVATIERGLWPYIIESKTEFNRASNAEIQMLALIVTETDLGSEMAIKKFTGLKKVNLSQVSKWVTKTKLRLLNNHKKACKNLKEYTCAKDWLELQELSYKNLQKNLPHTWQSRAQESRAFHQRYLYEQVRLAALFPNITSEIDKLSDDEIDGFELSDGQFLLTYDDGPSNTRSQPLIKALNKTDIHAFFFLLGETLNKVNPSIDIYNHQCIASHGYEHKSHQKWEKWQKSLTDTRKALNKYQSGPYWFRPPYGQRNLALLGELKKHNNKVMLWNIDSQDWNRKLTNQQVADRVTTLMLLWRRGIILYHDIHKPALHNLPILQKLVNQSELLWLDCRQFDTVKVD
ncbi:polysaccharide deacetylase family protein [Vibrio campbellii]|uniref:polysaccharide deacetylase family protein n=1 Tax=Vibrio campbellii TaxID=680 RepID=UPI00210B50D2|nr:polysaccharide deacetylase family protein [Vibrio campbellii]UTZ23590.1 polysaccharide deacetylase family protein [Vibrio campbellii]